MIDAFVLSADIMKRIPRRHLGACIASGLLAGLAAPALSAPMTCTAAATPVEKAICASPTLVAADRKMAAAFAQRLGQCPPSEQALLRQTQRFWLRDREACSNALSEGGNGAVARCAAERMAERGAQFGRIGATCNLDAVADAYRYVDADYMADHALQYVGKEVSVAGGIQMTSCDVQSSDLTATLTSGPGKAGFSVHFKAMSALQREWLCAQRPSSGWKGTVRQEHGVVYLYLTDILGGPL
jgi:uncharacterized protein YecT (DUF1311 family)